MTREVPAPRRRRTGDRATAAIDRRQPGRLERIEAALDAMQRSLDVQFNRIAGMQAEIGLLRAKRGSS
jgi:hypothetical protein